VGQLGSAASGVEASAGEAPYFISLAVWVVHAGNSYGMASLVPLAVVDVGVLIMMQNSTTRMHRYILGWIGLMVAFGVTVPIAILRVSANPKFANQPLNSQTCDSRNPEIRTVTSWIKTCSQMRVAPIAPVVKPATK
jgi:hypothetical protein